MDRLAQQTRQMVGDEVRAYVVLGGPAGQEPTAAVLFDATGDLARVFGERRDLAAVIRPDGYLGYRGRIDQSGDLASYLARVFAMRMRGMPAGVSTAP